MKFGYYAVMKRVLFNWTLLVVSLFLQHRALCKEDLLSMTVGRVGEHVVTSREVEASFILEDILYQKTSYRKEDFSSYQTKVYSSLVNSLLLEWVVYLEAKGFSATRVSKKEVTDAEALVRQKTSEFSRWRQLAMAENEWKAMVGRKLQAKAFMKFKANSSVVPVTEGEAERYYRQNRQKFGNRSFSRVKEDVYRQLGSQQIQKRLKDWFEVLQSKYKVRNSIVVK